MQTCDVLVVGGGPAGSSCARELHRVGLDVIVMDRAVFPRDKVCAGWITPQVIADLEIDCDEYRQGRTFQPITGFLTGLIDGGRDTSTEYDRPVSFGIRRCEFDHYLLQRSGARVVSGTPVTSLRREGEHWIVNDTVRASMLVGAGGHFCPIARTLNPVTRRAALVAAQEAEFPIEDGGAAWATVPEVPELYFCRDLKGYGWCFRKGEYLNIGLGRIDGGSLTTARDEFVAFLRARRRIPTSLPCQWRGHAYLVSNPPRRRVLDAGVLLAGDAAGLAYPESGEGIRPAIESGLLAASTIVRANGRYTDDRLAPYGRMLEQRFARRPAPIPPGVAKKVAPWLFQTPWFLRHLVLDRWFLHSQVPALTARRPVLV